MTVTGTDSPGMMRVFENTDTHSSLAAGEVSLFFHRFCTNAKGLFEVEDVAFGILSTVFVLLEANGRLSCIRLIQDELVAFDSFVLSLLLDFFTFLSLLESTFDDCFDLSLFENASFHRPNALLSSTTSFSLSGSDEAKILRKKFDDSGWSSTSSVFLALMINCDGHSWWNLRLWIL